mmetsp:Transcript_21095/g.27706  ORF Transcript_21095/g.27706 Transcript_21095/m.27706 type:complete len:101 (+) Transcript_21095:338-640(+)
MADRNIVPNILQEKKYNVEILAGSVFSRIKIHKINFALSTADFLKDLRNPNSSNIDDTVRIKPLWKNQHTHKPKKSVVHLKVHQKLRKQREKRQQISPKT